MLSLLREIGHIRRLIASHLLSVAMVQPQKYGPQGLNLMHLGPLKGKADAKRS